MEKEQLLEEAKRRYPIGTKFFAINTHTECIVQTGMFERNSSGGINEFNNSGHYIITNMNYHCVYYKNKWAEVISLPEPVNYEIY